MVELKMVRNYTKPDLLFTILYAEGPNKDTAFDLTGCTVHFYLMKTGGTTLKNTGHTTCSLTDEANGEGKYTWAADDLDEKGTYKGELEVIFVDTTKQTIYDPAVFKVRADYDDA